MQGSAGARLRRRERLTKGAEYRRVFRDGVRIDGPLFLMVALENDRGHGRLGLAASRRMGGAVDRNRAKRLLRESFRRHKQATESFDLVLVPKREIVEPSQLAVDTEFRERLRRLVARRAARRRRQGPAVPR